MNDIIRVVWLFPDTLSLHGERGNILALKRIANKMNLNITIDKFDFENKNFNFMDYDFIFLGAGELVSLKRIKAHLFRFIPMLNEYILNNKTLLATGTTIALFGNEINRANQNSFTGLNLMSFSTQEKETVYGDDIIAKFNFPNSTMDIIGNQIQMIDILLQDENPLGEVIYGYGNNLIDNTEGVRKNNAYLTNVLGPVLVTNPWFGYKLLENIAEVKQLEYKPINEFELETKSYQLKYEFIREKESKIRK
jgi:CobQ-like glutamine amidotransferase family enzyme